MKLAGNCKTKLWSQEAVMISCNRKEEEEIEKNVIV